MIAGLILLLLILLAVLVYPALRQAEAAAAKPDELQTDENLRLYKERRDDIEQMELDAADREAMLLELDRELLAAADSRAAFANSPGKGARLILMAFLLSLSLAGTWVMYQFWGAGNEVRATQLLEFSTQAELRPAEYEELEIRMARASERDPENMDWAFLRGRLFEAEGRFADAAQAYAELLDTLKPEQVQDRAAILTLVAQARFFAANQEPSEDIYNQLKEALELSPEQRKPLGLAGILAYELGYYEEAIGYWRKLWIQLPGGMEARTIENGIQRAAEVIEQQGGSVDLSWMVPARIEVVVSISDEARAAVDANTTVFVLARALQGPPMPLAVQRLTVSQLPTKVVLDGSVAMAPGMPTLGSVDEVTVTARVSLSGQPLAQPGDWQIQQAGVASRGSDAISLEISELVSE
ncbi:MAG: c-type cytochrome biogenesis protein CcmI [Thalassolituus sp.]